MKKISFLFLLVLVIPFALNAQIISTYAGCSIPGYMGDGGWAVVAEIKGSFGIRSDDSGNIYFSDNGNNVIRKVDLKDNIYTIAGNNTLGYSGDSGLATKAELNYPVGIGTDIWGNIYIADQGNNAIRRVNKAGYITTIAGNGSQTYSGDGSAATRAGLNAPSGVIADNKGNIYVADQGNYVIRKINIPGIITTIAGNNKLGYSGDGGLATAATLSLPRSICLDSVGNLYIADYGNNVVRKVNTAGIISTVAGNGTSGFSGDGGLAVSAELNGPGDVTIDKGGNLYIADVNNHVIRKVNASGIISTFAGVPGVRGYNLDGIPADSANLNFPHNITMDKVGNLFIADTYNFRVRKVQLVPTSIDIESALTTMSVYPNPAQDNVVVSSKNAINSITVINSAGQTVYSQRCNKLNEVQINLKDMMPGIYFVKVNNVYIQKLQKR